MGMKMISSAPLKLADFSLNVRCIFFPKDERSFEGELKQDLTQLIKHLKTLAEEGVGLMKVYIVYNYDLADYEYQINTIMQLPKFAGDVAEYDIELIGPIEIVDTIEEIKYLSSQVS
jgi:hypothetical protein